MIKCITAFRSAVHRRRAPRTPSDPRAGTRTPAPQLRSAGFRNSSHHATWHHTTPHHNKSHHITSHQIISHHITLHHITSHHITSHHITSHGITWHHITSRQITSNHISTHHITSHSAGARGRWPRCQEQTSKCVKGGPTHRSRGGPRSQRPRRRRPRAPPGSRRFAWGRAVNGNPN